ncbi:ImmA/IrrE family metallo-endopeptidase [Corynebacterium sp. H127]|uniref:ImmA/IrrE family metallo-endopeptidase n=1 Tax=Corynebacterium sp. H127 TaxID=3133418 RepID=UPI0030A963DF
MDPELKLISEAELLKVEIEPDRLGYLEEGDLAGFFPEIRTIFYQPWLGPRNRISSIAHELGHAALGHIVDPPEWLHPRQEKEADLWAARLLIRENDYIAADHHCDGHPGAIAQELGVTRRLVLAWRTFIEREMAS